MLKVLAQDQVRWMDAETMQREPITSLDLMERAARIFSQWFTALYPPERPIIVLAGTGNNGGDGLAVARHLLQARYRVDVQVAWFSERGTDDFQMKLERLERLHPLLTNLRTEQDLKPFPAGSLVIDALFGSGLNRPLAGFAAALVNQLNQSAVEVVAIDLPSGLSADGPGSGPAVRATRCLCLGAPKKALLLPDSAPFCAHWDWRPIGWPDGLAATLPCPDFYVQTADLAASLVLRGRFDHKNIHGHVLVVGGRAGMRGAAWLAAQAALRAGAGLASCWLSSPGMDHCPGRPELMHTQDPSALFSQAVLAIGPGMGTDENARRQLELALDSVALPPVLDADALNLLTLYPALLEKVPAGSVLTPHPGEFTRMFGASSNSFERLEKLREAAQKLGCTIVLKGAHSATATPEGQVFFNSSGNPGMATAGSGDVLTGVIAALRAQGLPPEKAAWAGVCWHGLAGDRAAAQRGQAGLLASDLVEELPIIRKMLAEGLPV